MASGSRIIACLSPPPKFVTGYTRETRLVWNKIAGGGARLRDDRETTFAIRSRRRDEFNAVRSGIDCVRLRRYCRLSPRRMWLLIKTHRSFYTFQRIGHPPGAFIACPPTLEIFTSPPTRFQSGAYFRANTDVKRRNCRPGNRSKVLNYIRQS